MIVIPSCAQRGEESAFSQGMNGMQMPRFARHDTFSGFFNRLLEIQDHTPTEEPS
jgi:hypothetical protein